VLPTRAALASSSFTIACVTAIVLMTGSACLAQVAGGTISGSVRDSSGRAIAGAQVAVRNSETAILRSIDADNDGIYTAPNLVAGTYQVSASKEGFATLVRSGVLATVGSEEVIDFKLKPGEVRTKIEVSDTPPAIQLASSALEATENSTTVRELPLNGRDWATLAQLQVGVTGVYQYPLALSNQRANRGLGVQLSIGGTRPQGNNYRLDGININDYSNGGPGSVLGVLLGVEAIQEFSVVTNSAPASYGRTSGGVINSITRSGTNELHGSAYEFLRNSALDARNFFDTTSSSPPFRRNQFGADAGGPVVKSKLFLFGDYEGIRQLLSTTTVDIVPSAAARTGNLTTGTVRVDPSVEPYLALYPLPNSPVEGDTGNFTLATPQNTNEDFFTSRSDFTIGKVDSLFATYMFDNGKTEGPDSFNENIIGTLSRRQAAVLEETHSFGAQMTNTARLGFSRVVSQAAKSLRAINPVAADTSLGFLPGQPVGVITNSELSTFPGGFGAVGEFDFHYNSYQFYDDAFATLGTHSLKFGFAFENIRDNELGKTSPLGQFVFGSLSDFLQDQPTSFNAPIGSGITPRALRQSIDAGYVMDDWRARPNLTLNLGLRYEAATVPSEAHGKLSNLPSLTSTTPHLGDPFFSNPTKLDFEPRVGFAWDPLGNGKTSVRAGFGIFDNLPLPYLFGATSLLSAPFFELGDDTNLPQGSFPKRAFPLLTTPTLRYAYIQPNPPRSYDMEWNFNIQQSIARDMVLQVGYTGSRGIHLPYFTNNFDMVLPTLTPQGYVWPVNGTPLNPNVGQISGTMWNSDSIFHALEVQATRKLNHGLQAGVSYAWGKITDSGSESANSNPGTFANSAPTLWFDERNGRGLADFDIRQNLSVNYIWEVPGRKAKPRALQRALNGWQWGGILHIASGEPFTPIITGDPLRMKGDQFDRPDVLRGRGCSGSLVNPGNPLDYIKTQCFAFPNPSTRFGDAGRNILIGPGILNLDTSLIRNLGGSEKFHAQFRAEFFNVLNHTNFASPVVPTNNTSLFGANGAPISSAGVLTSTTTTSRQIQFGLKLIW
jgi:Carboxypeptidase regulatory-like domain/TonB-dependent Receptor Plug Domain/TonB dependent receptor